MLITGPLGESCQEFIYDSAYCYLGRMRLGGASVSSRTLQAPGSPKWVLRQQHME